MVVGCPAPTLLQLLGFVLANGWVVLRSGACPLSTVTTLATVGAATPALWVLSAVRPVPGAGTGAVVSFWLWLWLWLWLHVHALHDVTEAVLTEIVTVNVYQLLVGGALSILTLAAYSER